jgi:divalent metal cation (Fe/Co/Zn/Cd) transporter
MSISENEGCVETVIALIILGVMLYIAWLVVDAIIKNPTPVNIVLAAVFAILFLGDVIWKYKFEFTRYHNQTVENIVFSILWVIFAYFIFFLLHAVPRYPDY